MEKKHVPNHQPDIVGFNGLVYGIIRWKPCSFTPNIPAEINSAITAENYKEKNMGCDLGAEYLLRNYLESSRVHQYPIPPMYPTIYLPLITYIWIREDGSQSKCHK